MSRSAPGRISSPASGCSSRRGNHVTCMKTSCPKVFERYRQSMDCSRTSSGSGRTEPHLVSRCTVETPCLQAEALMMADLVTASFSTSPMHTKMELLEAVPTRLRI